MNERYARNPNHSIHNVAYKENILPYPKPNNALALQRFPTFSMYAAAICDKSNVNATSTTNVDRGRLNRDFTKSESRPFKNC